LRSKRFLFIILALLIFACGFSAIFLFSKLYDENDVNIYGKTYSSTELIYHNSLLSGVYTAHTLKPSFKIDEDGTALIKNYNMVASGTGLGSFDFEKLGKLKEVKLTKKNFDNYFRGDKKAWSSTETPEKIRKSNKMSWEFIYENINGYSVYFLLQNNNDMYAVLWYADSERVTDEHSDDSFVRYMFKIQESVPLQSFDFSENEIYSYYDSVEKIFKPNIILSKADNTFQFTYSLYSSHIGRGTYELTEEYLTLYDERNTYVFKTSGEDFVFDAQKSSPIPKFRYSADSYEAQSPVPDGAIFSRSVAQSYIEAQDIQVTERNTVDNAVGRAVLAEYDTESPDGLMRAESHVILKEEKFSPTPPISEATSISDYVTVYIVFMHRTYKVDGGTFETIDSTFLPAKLTFEERYTDNEPNYILTDFVASHSDDETKELFPEDITDDVLNCDKYYTELTIKANKKASELFDDIIDIKND